MYDELIEELRQHHCDAKEDDTQEVCEECAYDVIIADKSAPSGIASVCVCGLMNRAADAIEKLQKQLREEKVDNVNLTGWLAEEHAKVEELQGKLQALKDDTDMEIVEDGKTTRLRFVKKWVPVTERLPEEYGHYLANIEGGEFAQISWAEIVYFDGKIFRWEHISTEYPEEVSHWMPLPQPPKDGEA